MKEQDMENMNIGNLNWQAMRKLDLNIFSNSGIFPIRYETEGI